MTRLTKKDKAELHESSKKWLKENIKQNETIYYCVTHVSKSLVTISKNFLRIQAQYRLQRRFLLKPSTLCRTTRASRALSPLLSREC